MGSSRLYRGGATQDVKHEEREQDGEQAAAKRNGGQPPTASHTFRSSIHDGHVVTVSRWQRWWLVCGYGLPC